MNADFPEVYELEIDPSKYNSNFLVSANFISEINSNQAIVLFLVYSRLSFDSLCL